MDRTTGTLVLSILLAAAPAAFAIDEPPCDLPAVEAATGTTPVSSRAELDAWLSRCPSPLDTLTPGARQRFLDGLRFNERGVVDYPFAELTEALTTDEIGQVSRLLGFDMPIAGLGPDEAARLRAHEPAAEITPIEQRFDRFNRESATLERELDGSARGAAIVALYRSLFPTEVRISSADVHDLGLLYRAASTAAYYSSDPQIQDIAWEAYAKLAAEGFSTRSRTRDMMQRLLAAGRIDEARALASAEPEHRLPRLPAARDETDGRHDTSVWELGSPDALVRRHVSLAPVRIVVRASLGCGFSLAAAEAIAADPELGPLFRAHAVWLAPPGELARYEQVRTWNREHPQTPMVVIADWADWPMLDKWEGTPSFHVFREGELVDSASSWPIAEGNRDAVLAILRRAGLR